MFTYGKLILLYLYTQFTLNSNNIKGSYFIYFNGIIMIFYTHISLDNTIVNLNKKLVTYNIYKKKRKQTHFKRFLRKKKAEIIHERESPYKLNHFIK